MSGLFDDGFEVSVIPHTGGQTTLLTKRPGDVVNLENDVVGKYVQRLLGVAQGKGDAASGSKAAAQGQGAPGAQAERLSAAPPGGITFDYLAAQGF